MVKLVASDIDGTLLRYGAAEIPEEIFREIDRLAEKGVLFCPASGRQYQSLRGLFAPVADRVPFLCENGAIVYGAGSPGPVLGKTVMDRELALALSREIMALPGTEVLISGENTSYLCPKSPDFADVVLYFVGNNTTVVPTPEDVPEEIIKVSAYCPDRMGETRLALRRWGERFRMAEGGPAWLDFNLADKGTGLRQLCRAFGVELAEVMAFGDNYNDLPMLTLAGHPYLMETAAPELLARIPNHCGNVAEVLRTL